MVIRACPPGQKNAHASPIALTVYHLSLEKSIIYVDLAGYRNKWGQFALMDPCKGLAMPCFLRYNGIGVGCQILEMQEGVKFCGNLAIGCNFLRFWLSYK